MLENVIWLSHQVSSDNGKKKKSLLTPALLVLWEKHQNTIELKDYHRCWLTKCVPWKLQKYTYWSLTLEKPWQKTHELGLCSSLLPKQVFSLCSEHFSFPVKLRTQSGLCTVGLQSWPQMTEQSSRLLFTYPDRSVGFTGFPEEVGCITGLRKNWQSSPWTVQMGGEEAALWEKVWARVCYAFAKGA